MIRTLLIAANENAGIIDKLKIDMASRKLIGEFSLKVFLQSDLKNYTNQSHFILDVAAFKEKDEEFIRLLEGISIMCENATVIIYTNTHYSNSSFLNKLICAGYKNIIAPDTEKSDKENIRMMSDDLKECLINNQLRAERYKRFDLNNKISSFNLNTEKEISFENSSHNIALFGAGDRIDTSTFGIQIANYIVRNKGKSAYVFADSNAEENMFLLSEYFLQAEIINDKTTINNIDFYNSIHSLRQSEYNAVIYDFGNLNNTETSIPPAVNQVFLIAELKWNAVVNTAIAMQKLEHINYSLLLSSNEDNIKRAKALLQDIEYKKLNYSDNIFDNINDEVFNDLLTADENIKEELINEH